MKTLRLLLLLTILCLCSIIAEATTITISSTPISDYRGGGMTATLRIWAVNGSFFTNDGFPVIGGSVGSTAFYKDVTCTVVGTTLTIPTFTIYSTVDSPDNPRAKYTAAILDSRGQRTPFLSDFAVPVSLGTTVTWGQLRNEQASIPRAPDSTFYTRPQTDAQIAAAIGVGNPATTSTPGRVKASITPSDPASPTAVLTDDYKRVPTAAVAYYADSRLGGFATAVDAAVADGVSQVIVGDAETVSASKSVSLNIRVDGGGVLTVNNGVTLTLTGDVQAGYTQIFNLVGTGVVSFAGNHRLGGLKGTWWGAVGDNATNNRTVVQQAVTAAATMGGARISYPYGIYLINGTPTGTAGHKALILMPTVAFAGNELQEIEIAGPSIPPAVFGTVVTTNQPSTKTCIFKTTVNTDAVFGGSNGTDFTAVGLKMTNCIVRLPDNPSVIGVDGRLLGGLFLDWMGVDTGRYTTSIVQPTDVNQAAIITPQNGNNADQWLGHVFVTGSYYGISVNEHTSGDYLILAGNAVGLGFQTADHASYFKRVLCFNNTVNLQWNAAHYTTIEQLDIEHAATGGGVPVWQGTTYDFNDTGNVGHGEIKVHIIVAGVGIPTSWASELKTNGASGIKERRVGYPDYITRISLAAPQTLTTGVEAAISFTLEGEDPYNLHSNSVSPTLITVTRTDTYKICWTVDFDANATGVRTINFGLNGVSTIPGANFVPVTGIASRSAGCVYYPLTAGDAVDMRGLQSSGGNLDVTQAFFILQRQ